MLQACLTPVQVSTSGTQLLLLCMLIFLAHQPAFSLSQVALLLLHVLLELKHLLMACLLLCTRPEVQESVCLSESVSTCILAFSCTAKHVLLQASDQQSTWWPTEAAKSASYCMHPDCIRQLPCCIPCCVEKKKKKKKKEKKKKKKKRKEKKREEQ